MIDLLLWNRRQRLVWWWTGARRESFVAGVAPLLRLFIEALAFQILCPLRLKDRLANLARLIGWARVMFR